MKPIKIAIVNPNSTAGMTEKCRQVAEKYKNSNTEILAVNPTDSPPSIEGHYDEVQSLMGMMREIQQAEKWGADAYVIACFDDIGLAAAREIVSGPVLGICESAMHLTSMIASSFSVVTTLNRSVPIIEELVESYGMTRFCRKVRASDLPVLALEDPKSGAREKIEKEILKAVQEDNCEAVILGCAGMADLTQELTQACKIPVIDGVLSALKLAEAMVGAGFKTSKVNSYNFPRKK